MTSLYKSDVDDDIESLLKELELEQDADTVTYADTESYADRNSVSGKDNTSYVNSDSNENSLVVLFRDKEKNKEKGTIKETKTETKTEAKTEAKTKADIEVLYTGDISSEIEAKVREALAQVKD